MNEGRTFKFDFLKKSEAEKKGIFNWRQYIKEPEKISPEMASKLDDLNDLINKGGPEVEEFMHDLSSFSQPVLTMVNFFRDILTPDERKELLRAVRESGPVGIKLKHQEKKAE